MPDVLDHAHAAVTGDDAERLARRRAIRKHIAERDALQRRSAEFQKRVDDLDREADAAADVHREETAVPQKELQELEERVIEAAADRKPIPDGIEARRLELIGMIDTANVKLSDAVERIKRLRKEPAAEAQRLLSEVAQGAALEFSLMKPGVGNPGLLLKHFAAKQAINWCGARLEAARKELAKWEDHAAAANRQRDQESANTYGDRAARWKAEATAAGSAFFEATAAADVIYKQLMDE